MRRPALISVENVERKDSSGSGVVKKKTTTKPVETLLIPLVDLAVCDVSSVFRSALPPHLSLPQFHVALAPRLFISFFSPFQFFNDRVIVSACIQRHFFQWTHPRFISSRVALYLNASGSFSLFPPFPLPLFFPFSLSSRAFQLSFFGVSPKMDSRLLGDFFLPFFLLLYLTSAKAF